MAITKKIKEKKCSGCGRIKPKGEFLRGRNNNCSECRRQYNRLYKQSRKGEDARLQAGIETWDQVDSLMREMAESQYRIQKEYALLDKKIAILKKDTDGIIEPDLFHQINLRSMLMMFLKKALPPERAIHRKFDFGTLRFYRGKLNMDLDTDYAEQRMGKP
jgi:transposase-like protein